MRTLFQFTLLVAAMSLGGCSVFSSSEPAELPIEQASQYDDRQLDALGSQRYAEAQMLQQRRFNDFGDRIDELDAKAKRLQGTMNATAYENGQATAPASEAEAQRIKQYQDASRENQGRAAEEDSKVILKRSILENDRDAQLTSLDVQASREISDLERSADRSKSDLDLRAQQEKAAMDLRVQQDKAAIDLRVDREKASIEVTTSERAAGVRALYAQRKNEISSHTRTQIAALESGATIKKSSVVAPVVTGRAVYTGTTSQPSPAASVVAVTAKPIPAAPAQLRSSPTNTVSVFKPVVGSLNPQASEPQDVVLASGHGGSQAAAGAPVVVDTTRQVFDVLYVYKDKSSWEKFQNYLNAYGVKELFPSSNSKKGEWYIYAGRFYDQATANQRVAFLNKTSSTSHAQIRIKDIPK